MGVGNDEIQCEMQDDDNNDDDSIRYSKGQVAVEESKGLCYFPMDITHQQHYYLLFSLSNLQLGEIQSLGVIDSLAIQICCVNYAEFPDSLKRT